MTEHNQPVREAEAREVLARVCDERAGIHIHPVDYIAKRIAGTYGYQPCMSGDQRDRLNWRQRRSAQDLAEELYAAMLAFRPTPTTTGADEVERLREAFRAGWDKCWYRAPDAPTAVDGGREVAWQAFAARASLRAADAVRREVG
jgi:hypothetical protein